MKITNTNLSPLPLIRGGKPKLPLYLFGLLCLNLLLTPAVLAATGGALSPGQAYWLVALVLLTFALAIYLFFVIFVPEKF